MKNTYSLIFLLLIVCCSNNVQTTNSTPQKTGIADLSEDIATIKFGHKARNIILMIGDGMGLTQISAGMISNGGKLNLEYFKQIGFIKTHATDNLITDSAAGATAFACGKKTYNGAIAVDKNGNPLKTILEIAKESGLATGLVATSSITHATPAAFAAHRSSRDMYEEIAFDMARIGPDVMLGGGKNNFSSRVDGLNLLDSLKAKSYTIAYNIKEISAVTKGKLAGFIADDHPESVEGGRGDFLSIASVKAIELLGQNKNGFFLMIEGSQIDWAGHANFTNGIISEMLDFDRAIGEVLKFAIQDSNTLIIVTADHETGGFAINGGDISTGEVDGQFTTDHHTGVMVPVFAFGPGAELFQGIYDNTQIFNKMLKASGSFK